MLLIFTFIFSYDSTQQVLKSLTKFNKTNDVFDKKQASDISLWLKFIFDGVGGIMRKCSNKLFC